MWQCSSVLCGSRIPSNTVHAVSVCLSNLEDLVDYEKQVAALLEAMENLGLFPKRTEFSIPMPSPGCSHIISPRGFFS